MSNKNQNQKVEEELKNQQHTDKNAQAAAESQEAEAQKAALIAIAEGERRAIDLINEAEPSPQYITLQGFEALKKVADGKSTKIIVPSEIQNVAGLLTSIAEVIKTPSPAPTKDTTDKK